MKKACTIEDIIDLAKKMPNHTVYFSCRHTVIGGVIYRRFIYVPLDITPFRVQVVGHGSDESGSFEEEYGKIRSFPKREDMSQWFSAEDRFKIYNKKELERLFALELIS